MVYDSIIIGGGPCGVSCAIYLKRAGYNVLLIEKSFIGGQVALSAELTNYAGFVQKDAFAFCTNLQKQLKEYDIETKYEEVLKIEKTQDFCVETNKCKHYAKTCILSIGAESRKLGIEKEQYYIGKGLSYCAVCDGNFYRNKEVAVIGGGNSAMEDIVYLSKICKIVNVIHRKSIFSAEKNLISQVNSLLEENGGNVKIFYNSNVVQFDGEDFLKGVSINQNGEIKKLELDGVFLDIGRIPKVDFIKNLVEIEKNYIVVDQKFQTKVEGLFAGGDCIDKKMRQVVTAVSDGALISKYVSEFLQ